MNAGKSLADLGGFLVAPGIAAPLDPGFRPAILARRALEEAARRSPRAVRVSLAVEQPAGSTYVRDAWVFSEDTTEALTSYRLCERLIKSMLWSRGGCRVWVDGPDSLVTWLRRYYDIDAVGSFDAEMMERVYGTPLEVVAAPRVAFPASYNASIALGGHLDGCRIGFDLGASDRKAAAVINGEVVFSEEIAWDPSRQSDPRWHFDQIMDSLQRAAAHLPRVDAIGGSAAGIYVDGEVRFASLFRSVPPDLFNSRVRVLFHEIRAAWGEIPFAVANDGDVTALAGAMYSGSGGILGIAMGSSEAAGYATRARGLTGWLNELAFVPVDYGLDAPVDEWSGDRGCGARYFSQQSLPRLLPAAGIEVEADAPLPERLVLLQRLMDAGDERAALVYETIGTHLGYALLEYREFYDFDQVLLLGRVMTGQGGEVIRSRSIEVLEAEGSGAAIRFHAVSEREKRHGQAVAAASLPSRDRPGSETGSPVP